MKIMKRLVIGFLCMLMVIGLYGTFAACITETTEVDLISVVDMLGEEVQVKKNPSKVACVSRTTFDLLIAFGLGDVIDGAYYSLLDNEWASIFYPNANNLYSYQYEESYETFITRGVELVFAPEKYLADGLKEHGIVAMNVSLYGNPNFDSYIFYFADLVKTLWGERPGVSEKVEAWKELFTEVQLEITTELNKHNDVTKMVYYVRGDKNKGIGYTDTGSSFIEYAYKVLGCDYVGNRFESNRPSAEEICEINPDAVVIGGIYQKDLINLIKTTEPYVNLDAVKNDQVFNIPIGLTMFEQISIFSPVFLCDQANKLYPEYFNFDVTNQIVDIANEFFGVTLTSIEANNMLSGFNREGQPLA